MQVLAAMHHDRIFSWINEDHSDLSDEAFQAKVRELVDQIGLDVQRRYWVHKPPAEHMGEGEAPAEIEDGQDEPRHRVWDDGEPLASAEAPRALHFADSSDDDNEIDEEALAGVAKRIADVKLADRERSVSIEKEAPVEDKPTSAAMDVAPSGEKEASMTQVEQ
jgi:hypothetical protein